MERSYTCENEKVAQKATQQSTKQPKTEGKAKYIKTKSKLNIPNKEKKQKEKKTKQKKASESKQN